MKKLTALVLALAMVFTLAACVNTDPPATDPKETNPQETTPATRPSETKPVAKEDLPVLGVYPYVELSAGLDQTYRSDIYAENGFQVEIWAFSDEKTNAILTSGDLPDIMYVNVGETLDTLIETGKVLKLDDYLDQLPNLYDNSMMEESLNYLRNVCSAGTGELYGLPVGVGVFPSAHDKINPTAGNSLKLKWDVYEAIGTPKISNYWDVLDVMEAMLEAMPTHADGSKMYGTVLNSGFDTNYWGCMTYWFAQQGYHYNNLKFLLELDMETSEMRSILSKGSMYYQGLKWYNEAMRRGLIDPDSINTDRATQNTKISNGYVMVPMGSLPGSPSSGYYPYLIPGTTIYCPMESYIPSRVIVVNAESENLEECLAYLNLMCNADAQFELQNGPEGDIWESKDGVITFTEKYAQWLAAGNGMNGYPMSDGAEYSSGFNLPSVHLGGEVTSWKNTDGKNVNIALSIPESFAASESAEAYQMWQETMGVDSWLDILADEKTTYITLPDYDQFKGFLSAAPEDDMLKLTQAALKDIVVTASWQMVYAESDAEFEAIWNKMVEDCNESGAQDLIDWRLNDVAQAREKWEAMNK